MVIVAEIGSLTAGTAAAGLSFILIVMVSMTRPVASSNTATASVKGSTVAEDSSSTFGGANNAAGLESTLDVAERGGQKEVPLP